MSLSFAVPDWDAGAAPSASFSFNKKKPKPDATKPKAKPDQGKPKPDKTKSKPEKKVANPGKKVAKPDKKVAKPDKKESKPTAGQFVRPNPGSANNTPSKPGKRKHENSSNKLSTKNENNKQSPAKKRKLDNSTENPKKLKGPIPNKKDQSPGKKGKPQNNEKSFSKKGNDVSKKPENKFAKPLPVKPVKKVKKAKPAKPIEMADVDSDTELSAEVNQFRKQLMKGFTGPKESDGKEVIEFSDAEDLQFTDSDDDGPSKPKKNAFGEGKTKEVVKKGKKVQEHDEENTDGEEAPALVPIDSFRSKLIGNLKGSRFRYLNELMYSSEGASSVKLFKEDRGAFAAYHDGYRQQVEQWPLNPLDRIIKSIKKLPKTLVIADFGCGEGRLAKAVPNKTYSLDLVAARHEIIACDMANTPLETNSIDVAVYCLSLMGTNLKDFLLEANRVMKVNGTLKIAEVESRFEDVRKFVENVKSCGFQHVNTDSSSKFFVFLNFKKVRNVEKGSKQVPAFSLKPCLYKKR